MPCENCHRARKVYDPSLKAMRLCPGCGGDGWRIRRKGEPEWDEYLGQPVATAETRKPEPMSPARLDAELQRVERDLLLRSGGVDPNEAFDWERKREARDKGASYAELERVLGELQIELPPGRSFIAWVYHSGLNVSLSPSAARTEEILIGWIADRMRGKVRIPREYFDEQQAELRQQARWLTREGLTEAEVAKHLGISRSYVRDSIKSAPADTLRVSLRGPDSEPGEACEPLHARIPASL